jgi:hypothetical protein
MPLVVSRSTSIACAARAKLEERGAGIEQEVDAFSRQQPAARGVPRPASENLPTIPVIAVLCAGA